MTETDADADETFESSILIEYLNDSNSLTGYSQVLRETHIDPSTDEIQKVVEYVIGLDQISQTTVEYTSGVPGTPTTLFFASDGHGSVRILLNAAAAIATLAGVRQLFHYDAYGNAIGFNAAAAATTVRYSGEHIDRLLNFGYNRDRWLDFSTGRFIGLDRYSGNPLDPQSFHKSLYAHGDPINGTDPSGREVTIGGVLSAAGIGATIGALTNGGYVLYHGGTWAQAGNAAWEGAKWGAAAGVIAYLSAAAITGALVSAGFEATAVGTFYAVSFGSGFITGAALEGLHSLIDGDDPEEIFWAAMEGGIKGAIVGGIIGVVARGGSAALSRIRRPAAPAPASELPPSQQTARTPAEHEANVGAHLRENLPEGSELYDQVQLRAVNGRTGEQAKMIPDYLEKLPDGRYQWNEAKSSFGRNLRDPAEDLASSFSSQQRRVAQWMRDGDPIEYTVYGTKNEIQGFHEGQQLDLVQTVRMFVTKIGEMGFVERIW